MPATLRDVIRTACTVRGYRFGAPGLVAMVTVTHCVYCASIKA